MNRVTSLDLIEADDRAEGLRRKFLQERGWNHTSSGTPGALWLWEREIDGRRMLLSESTAITVQQSLDADAVNLSPHEFGECGECIHCGIDGDAFERGGFVAECQKDGSVER